MKLGARAPDSAAISHGYEAGVALGPTPPPSLPHGIPAQGTREMSVPLNSVPSPLRDLHPLHLPRPPTSSLPR